MQTLTKASRELFRRRDDERFSSMEDLLTHCESEKAQSQERWTTSVNLNTVADGGRLRLLAGDEGVLAMNDWSFSQLCRLGGVSKDTVNKVSPHTAQSIFQETLPRDIRMNHLFTRGDTLRSMHGGAYTRLYNADLLKAVTEFTVDFQPPQTGMNGAGGLYCGEQDMFVFLIDPLGWIDIEGESFAPGFFLWNSEVGRRTVGVQSFWFQAVCQNHIVWDAVEVVEYNRRHTKNVVNCTDDICRILNRLVRRRDERKDRFAEVIAKAMGTKLDEDQEKVLKKLRREGIPRTVAEAALAKASEKGAFTLFSVVDALTRQSGKLPNAGDRLEIDQKAGAMLYSVA